jgi:hypothetical protein
VKGESHENQDEREGGQRQAVEESEALDLER